MPQLPGGSLSPGDLDADSCVTALLGGSFSESCVTALLGGPFLAGDLDAESCITALLGASFLDGESDEESCVTALLLLDGESEDGDDDDFLFRGDDRRDGVDATKR